MLVVSGLEEEEEDEKDLSKDPKAAFEEEEVVDHKFVDEDSFFDSPLRASFPVDVVVVVPAFFFPSSSSSSS